MSLSITEDGKAVIDINEVRLITGNFILFKNDPKQYVIGEDVVNSILKGLMSAPSPRSPDLHG